MTHFAPDWRGALSTLGLAYLLALGVALAVLEIPRWLRTLFNRSKT